MHDFIKYLRAQRKEIYDQAYFQARMLLMQMESDLERCKLEGKDTNQFNLIARARERGGWISMEWLRPRFYGPVNKRVRHWRYLKRDRALKQPIRSLGRTTQWEREMFMQIEPVFTELRTRQKRLKKEYRDVRSNAKKNGDFEGAIRLRESLDIPVAPAQKELL